MLRILSLCVLATVLAATPGRAEENKVAEYASIQALPAEEQEEGVEATQEFAGGNFGMGLTVTLNNGDSRIEDAEIAGGKVRVKKEKNDFPRVMLELHNFMLPNRNLLSIDSMSQGTWGIGPFVALQSSSEEAIDSFGIGFMLGIRPDVTKSRSFNIGLGAVLDPGVKTLGDEIKENEPLPDGETEIRFKEKSEWGVLLAVSFSFN